MTIKKSKIKSAKAIPKNQSPVCFLESEEVQEAYKYPVPLKKTYHTKKSK